MSIQDYDGAFPPGERKINYTHIINGRKEVVKRKNKRSRGKELGGRAEENTLAGGSRGPLMIAKAT